MKYAAFHSLEGAKAHRSEYGGWIFVPTGGEHSGDVYWFAPHYFPSAIFVHPLLKGMSGKLI